MDKKVRLYIDIDGVLAKNEERLKFLKEKKYDAFYGCAMADDMPIDVGKMMLEILLNGVCRNFNGDWYMGKVDVCFITGRPERTRTLTRLWLNDWIKYNEPFDYRLLMREDNDHRPSADVKAELVKEDGVPLDSSAWSIYYIDDDPTNCKAVEEILEPWLCDTAVLCFGTKRYGELLKKEVE